MSCVKEAWNRQGLVRGRKRLSLKIKRTKVALRVWNVKVFGRVDVILKELEERVTTLEHQLQLGFSPEIEVDYLTTKLEIKIWEKREATRLDQMAKKKWLMKGNQNTQFFHASIN